MSSQSDTEHLLDVERAFVADVGFPMLLGFGNGKRLAG